jgi:flagellar FliL protein
LPTAAFSVPLKDLKMRYPMQSSRQIQVFNYTCIAKSISEIDGFFRDQAIAMNLCTFERPTRAKHRWASYAPIYCTWLFCWFCLPALEVWAEETPPVMVKESIYLPLKPAFIVNYGGEGKLRYIKADITARMNNSEAADAVRHHLPLIRNNLVRLLSSQTDESLESQEGKEALRLDALREIQHILKDEEGIEGVEDVLFNSFIVQK